MLIDDLMRLADAIEAKSNPLRMLLFPLWFLAVVALALWLAGFMMRQAVGQFWRPRRYG